MGKVEIRDETLEGIQERVKVSEFDSAEEYVNFVLEEVLRQVERDESPEEDEEAVEKRLRDLGYL